MSNSRESQLQGKLLLEAPKRFPNMRLFRRNVGKARLQGGYVVRFALPGQCDLYGIVRGGRHIEIELKGIDGKLKPDQVTWKTWCDEWGVPHLVLTASKLETDEETVDRWCREIGILLSGVTACRS